MKGLPSGEKKVGVGQEKTHGKEVEEEEEEVVEGKQKYERNFFCSLRRKR